MQAHNAFAHARPIASPAAAGGTIATTTTLATLDVASMASEAKFSADLATAAPHAAAALMPYTLMVIPAGFVRYSVLTRRWLADL